MIEVGLAGGFRASGTGHAFFWYTSAMKRILFCLLAALLAGCATVLERATPAAVRLGEVKVETVALVEALRARAGVSVQALNGSWRDQAFQAQCVAKGDGETLTLVFLAPQMRLLTITVTRPHAIRCERAPRIPAAFEPEYALVDYAFANLDAATLRRVAGTALRIEDDGTTRRIATAAGEPVAELTRAADGTRRFRNLLHGYEYQIKDIP